MSPDQHETARRGRRSTDWTLKRIIEIGTAIGLLWGDYTTISAYLGAKWATHTEVTEAVRPVVDTLNAFKRASAGRLDMLEARQAFIERRQDLIPGFLRLQCLQLRRDKSESLADA